jgi:hypothetical protein
MIGKEGVWGWYASFRSRSMIQMVEGGVFDI